MCLYDTWRLWNVYFPVCAMTHHVMLGIWWLVKLCKYNSLSKLSFDIWLVLVYFWLAFGLVLFHRHVKSFLFSHLWVCENTVLQFHTETQRSGMASIKVLLLISAISSSHSGKELFLTLFVSIFLHAHLSVLLLDCKDYS